MLISIMISEWKERTFTVHILLSWTTIFLMDNDRCLNVKIIYNNKSIQILKFYNWNTGFLIHWFIIFSILDTFRLLGYIIIYYSWYFGS